MADARRLVELGIVPPLAVELAAQINAKVIIPRRLQELGLTGGQAHEIQLQVAGLANPGRLAERGFNTVLAAEIASQISGGGSGPTPPTPGAFWTRSPFWTATPFWSA